MALTVIGLSGATAVRAQQQLLVPMDDRQSNALKAYGLVFNALRDGNKAEWLLNYRGGSFLLPDVSDVRKRATLDGITFEPISAPDVGALRTEIASANMDIVSLERAPKIAIYKPLKSPPWDDAVSLALKYAGIDFTSVYDEEVMNGDLTKVDWLHLHHEDFTGQLNKLYLGFRDTPWFIEQRDAQLATARKLGMPNIPALKKQVAERMRQFVENGGFLFAMCGATETLALAIAAHQTDIAGSFADNTPVDEAADQKLDWDRSFGFRGVHLEPSPFVNSMSDIDGHQVNVPGRRQPLGQFSLFSFSAKFDPVATMLVQNSRNVIPDFYGVTTSFTRSTIKQGVTILAQEEGAPWAKYLHGDYGKGSFTFLGGHDPEDPQHNIGAAPTDLALHPNSPGYRLILNNVLFPAAKKKPLKT
ncbi:MAG: asparagine synthetase B [Gemmatimonadetes bacterium]|nr:asparagine synthetase B [Gemmatimonadota bacterium]